MAGSPDRRRPDIRIRGYGAAKDDLPIGLPPARTRALPPLVNSPFLRLACTSSSSSRRRLDAPLWALSAGPRLTAGWGAPRARRVVAAFAREESVPFLL
ncbi:hypothetical protein ABZP36_016863 [Zizania latifolia]